MKKLLLAGILALTGLAFVNPPSADAIWYWHRRPYVSGYVTPYPYYSYSYYGYPYYGVPYSGPLYSTYYYAPGPLIVPGYPVGPYYYRGGYGYYRGGYGYRPYYNHRHGHYW